jgi:CBS domain-containing protein
LATALGKNVIDVTESRKGRKRPSSEEQREEAAMQVKDVMTAGVECVRPDDNIAAAAQKMKDLDVGAMPVCGDNDRLVGIVTDRDITVRATAGCCDPGGTCVQDVMTPKVTYVFEDQDVKEAAQLMKQEQIRRLVVLNRNKRLAGIVSLGDLAVETRDEELVGATLEAVSEPATSGR